MENAVSSSSTHIKRGPIAALLLAGTFIAILNQTLMITAIPPIMHQMHITANTAQWLTTVFMLVNGVMIPVSAFLIEKFSTRRLSVTAMSIFAVGTVVCGFAPDFKVLLVGRIIQSSGAGIMLPLMQTVFLMIFPVKKRGAAMGLIGLVISFAPAIGPALSGWITEHYTWRLLFALIFPIAVIDIGVAYFALKNVTKLSNPKVDVRSIALSSIGFGGLLYGFSSAGNYGWESPLTLITLGVGAASLLVFIIRQLKLSHPMLEFRVFQYKIFALSTFIGMIVFMGLIGGETLVPLYLQNVRGFNAMDSGLFILPGALVTGIMSPITGRIFDRIGAQWLSIIGMLIIIAGTIPFCLLTPATSYVMLTIMYAVRLLGMSMVMMPVSTAGLNELPRRLIPHGAAMNNTMRQVAASIGTAILVTVMTTTASAAQHSVDYPRIRGINVAFIVAIVLAFIAFAASIFLRKTEPPEEEDAQIWNNENSESIASGN